MHQVGAKLKNEHNKGFLETIFSHIKVKGNKKKNLNVGRNKKKKTKIDYLFPNYKKLHP